MKEAPLNKILKRHQPTCSYYIYSGDRHCSCGRDKALEQIEIIRADLRIILARGFEDAIVEHALKVLGEPLKVQQNDTEST